MDDEDDFYLDEQDTDRCEHRGCQERGVAYNDNGKFLCEEHLMDWMAEDMAGEYTDEEDASL